jgi:hypothetical protein
MTMMSMKKITRGNKWIVKITMGVYMLKDGPVDT